MVSSSPLVSPLSWYAFTPAVKFNFLNDSKIECELDCVKWGLIGSVDQMKILSNGIAVLEGDTHISKWVEESGRLDHDQWAMEMILPYIKEGDWVVDGGAFIGDHTTAYLKAVGRMGRVFAFEPNPAAYECLVHNCSDAITYPFGLGNLKEDKKFYRHENVGASSVSEEGDSTIMLTSLDSYDLEQLDFLKLDIEGCELKALQGAEGTICEYRPVMWLEINRVALERQGAMPKDVLWFLMDYEYDVEPYPEEGGEQYDVLCIPR